MGFRYEALAVWPLALEYVDACFIVADGLPQRAQFSIGEQLHRAATSIVANIAEGSGKNTERSERNFYDIARGSLAETIGLLALCQRRKYLDDDRHSRLYNRAGRISAMLWGLLKANQDKRIADEQDTYIISESLPNDNLEIFFAPVEHTQNSDFPHPTSRIPLQEADFPPPASRLPHANKELP